MATHPRRLGQGCLKDDAVTPTKPRPKQPCNKSWGYIFSDRMEGKKFLRDRAAAGVCNRREDENDRGDCIRGKAVCRRTRNGVCGKGLRCGSVESNCLS